MIEVTGEMMQAFAEGDTLREGLAAALAIVERDCCLKPRGHVFHPLARPLPKDPLVPHSHVCVSCSPDGAQRGPGCHNCRNTGMDQTPCMAAGHEPYCPGGCCYEGSISTATQPLSGGEL